MSPPREGLLAELPRSDDLGDQLAVLDCHLGGEVSRVLLQEGVHELRGPPTSQGEQPLDQLAPVFDGVHDGDVPRIPVATSAKGVRNDTHVYE